MSGFAMLLGIILAMVLLAVACGGGEEAAVVKEATVDVKPHNSGITPHKASLALKVRNLGDLGHSFIVLRPPRRRVQGRSG